MNKALELLNAAVCPCCDKSGAYYDSNGDVHQCQWCHEVSALAAQPVAESDLVARLRQEAQIHAQEARTANATIAEIYQIVSEGKGEPGNWHGAEPVRRRIAELKAAQPVAVPDGFVMVPVEPTLEMVAALGWGGDELLAMGHALISSEIASAYKAMLAAAPKPEQEAPGCEVGANLTVCDDCEHWKPVRMRGES